MAVRPDRISHSSLRADPLPALLTVEEAAELLRIGRTKAYAMTREWRTTGGLSGLPVVDFGSVLRVPLAALEARIGGPLVSGGPSRVAQDLAPEEPASAEVETPTATPRRGRRRAGGASGQLGLFGPTA